MGHSGWGQGKDPVDAVCHSRVPLQSLPPGHHLHPAQAGGQAMNTAGGAIVREPAWFLRTKNTD